MLRADTETETIERAFDIVIAEHERNRLTIEANKRFVTSGIDVDDVYGGFREIDAAGSISHFGLHCGPSMGKRSCPDVETVGR
jgi:hypothetical protein